MTNPPVPDELTESFQPVIGAAVTLRPLRPEDVDIETAFVEGLSAESRGCCKNSLPWRARAA